MVMLPLVHVGIRSGTSIAPSLSMSGNGGELKVFISGLMGHMIFGLVVPDRPGCEPLEGGLPGRRKDIP
jgi:hypothetical protein